MTFIDRADAGRQLAAALEHLRGADVVLLGLPRGGVPVAAEVARVLRAPLDVIVVRKVGVPGQPELAMAAVGEDGASSVNTDVVRMIGLDRATLAEAEARAWSELDARVRQLRGGRPRIPLSRRTAVIVDDGVATGATARAACEVARASGAARVVLAAPVAPAAALAELAEVADEVVCVERPRHFRAVGHHYQDFRPVSDAEVAALLAEAGEDLAEPHDPAGPGPEVAVTVAGTPLAGQLGLPPGARGLVVFAHGSGSGRHSPRNRFVAEVLRASGLGTLLLDLLTADEAAERGNVFDIRLLADRLRGAIDWLRAEPGAAGLPVGIFGASTGAAAALWAAAEPDADIAAVVSRGGRPDLAGPRLRDVHAPTLLIVGGLDHAVLELNHDAQRELAGHSRLAVVPGAGHLFEEPGTLRIAADLAAEWFVEHLPPVPGDPAPER